MAGVALFIIAAVTYGVRGSRSFQNCVSQPGYANSAYQNQPTVHEIANVPISVSNWDCLGQFVNEDNAGITAIATVLLMVITGGLAIVGFMQIMTSRAELRAYVYIDEAHVDHISTGAVPEAQIKIRNFGRTPAYQFTQGAVMGIQAYPLTDDPPTAKDDAAPAQTLPPTAYVFSSAKLKKPLKDDEMRGLKEGKLAIFVVGEIGYTDCFGRQRFTNYCVFSGGGVTKLGDVASYKEGNKSN